MTLRVWQSECLELALNHFDNISKHFLCLATPGAGKTIMAAEVAFNLYKQNKIDFVLCFSPSTTICESIKNTFSFRFNSRFDGVIGAIGSSYTYQNILFFKEDFWQLLNNNRVLVVFDEIHHCSGSSVENANAWGEEVIKNIQEQASYTLALTGTPWRSDRAPIVLSNYLGEENDIRCDYIYGLGEAVRDGVCRSPKIVLIDNERLSVIGEDKQHQVFNSFQELLRESTVSYTSVVTNEDVMRHILTLGCNKLRCIRNQNPNAAGLVVASSVQHAQDVIKMLRDELEQSAVLVTYKQIKASELINQFRCSNIKWIVSVGMVSEGTDIPRLQVCCHLSRVKTELYFRQVLGRILRVSEEVNQEAWLYTFAEFNLSKFSHRVGEELPSNDVIIREYYPQDYINDKNKMSSKIALDKYSIVTLDGEFNSIDDYLEIKSEKLTNGFIENEDRSLEILGSYRELLISTFNLTL